MNIVKVYSFVVSCFSSEYGRTAVVCSLDSVLLCCYFVTSAKPIGDNSLRFG